MINTLERLISGEDPTATMLFFELHLLDNVGYRPELFRCVGCGEEIRPRDQFFSAAEGGILCPACGPVRGDARPISLTELKVLRHFVRNPFQVVTSAQIRPKIYEGLDRLMEGYISFLLERKLHAPDFIRRVLRMKQEGVESNKVQ
jgi:DNA repair protein RecO (recombination protein O)